MEFRKEAEEYLSKRGITQKMGDVKKHPSDLAYYMADFARQIVKNLNEETETKPQRNRYECEKCGHNENICRCT